MSVSNGQDRQKWYTELQHIYLPRFEDLGIAEYNSNESAIRYLGCPLISEPIEMVEAV